jgi:hypothetical protein
MSLTNSTRKNHTNKSAAVPADHNDDVSYIRGFLAQVKPLEACEVDDEYFEGRSLIERLALALEANTDQDLPLGEGRIAAAAKNYQWDATQCATVLGFLTLIQPVKGVCFCNDPSYSIHNATCGFHSILYFARDQVRRIATPQPKARKRAAEVAHV